MCASAIALDTRPDGLYLKILNLTASLRLSVAQTSASRPAARATLLNRLDSSTEIIFASGEGRQLTAHPRGFEFRADAFFRRGHFIGRQSVFLNPLSLFFLSVGRAAQTASASPGRPRATAVAR